MTADRTGVAIRVRDLAKRYTIGAARPYDTLRDHLSGIVRNGRSSPRRQDFWALKNVSFDVRSGDVVGIIGRNGSGKTTLLKILSRITEPTAGHAEIHGRVGSLLEVGTGFHGELTGRENIYLNGAILGMRKTEIARKLPEIVEFAGVEQFLETPVKHYSSGMYLRLGFAVAAHLEPDILMVDEVLAVGDIGFQKRCLGKLGEVAQDGRTVLLVSHNMAAIQSLCTSCLLLNGGELIAAGPPREIVDRYLQEVSVAAPISLEERIDRQGSGAIRFTNVLLRNAKDQSIDLAVSGQDISIAVAYRSAATRPVPGLDVHITFHTMAGQFMFTCSSEGTGHELDVQPGGGQLVCHIPALPLAPGQYSFNLYATSCGVVADWVREAGHVTVAAGDYFGTGRLNTHEGGFLVKHGWTAAVGAPEPRCDS